MKIVCLDAKTLGDDADLSVFTQFGTFEAFDASTPDEVISNIGDAKIILTNKVMITKETMDACPNLGLICVTATGMNNVDLEHAKLKGITVKNVAGYSTASVTQTTFTLVLSLLGQSAYYDNYVKSGEWVKSKIFTHLERPIVEIKDKKWGIIGFGTIGKEVAKVASAFGANVVYYSTSGANNDSSYTKVEFEELFKTCDIISIHAPLNDKTKGLVTKEALFLMKKGALLINVGRGGIVDEAALASAIDTNGIYAGIDVTAIEPMEEGNPLLHVKHKQRLAMSPHIAWASVESRQELIRLVGENIKDFIGQ